MPLLLLLLVLLPLTLSNRSTCPDPVLAKNSSALTRPTGGSASSRGSRWTYREREGGGSTVSHSHSHSTTGRTTIACRLRAGGCQLSTQLSCCC